MKEVIVIALYKDGFYDFKRRSLARSPGPSRGTSPACGVFWEQWGEGVPLVEFAGCALCTHLWRFSSLVKDAPGSGSREGDLPPLLA